MNDLAHLSFVISFRALALSLLAFYPLLPSNWRQNGLKMFADLESIHDARYLTRFGLLLHKFIISLGSHTSFTWLVIGLCLFSAAFSTVCKTPDEWRHLYQFFVATKLTDFYAEATLLSQYKNIRRFLNLVAFGCWTGLALGLWVGGSASSWDTAMCAISAGCGVYVAQFELWFRSASRLLEEKAVVATKESKKDK